MATATPDMSFPTARWDLSCLYNDINDPKIESTYQTIEAQVQSFVSTYKDKIQTGELSAAEFLKAIQTFESIYQELVKPIHYGNLLFSVDATNPEIGSFLSTQMEKYSEIRVNFIFFELEIQKLAEAKANEYLANPELAPYRHFIKNVRKAVPFTLSEVEEKLLETTSNVGIRAWQRLHDEVITHHKFNYRNPESGQVEQLTESEVLDHLRDASRESRIEAGRSLSEGLQELSHILTYIFNIVLQDNRLDVKMRNRPYAEHGRHTANEMEKETVDLVMRLCKKNEGIVNRYYKVKRDIMGLPELTHVDRYAPLFETKRMIGYDEGRRIVINSFRSFSNTMADRADEFFTQNWIDAEPRDSKTGGAFCNYITPDTHPVVMMSYLNKLDDVMTLAHELGHGVHGSLSRAQSLLNFEGSLPLAELASTFGEQLVFENIVKDSSTQDQLSLYAQKIEGSFATVFRQAAMFRFEQRAHQKRADDGELSPDEVGEIWQEEIQGMFGDSISIGEEHRSWWSYVGHFIGAPFYVYAYSFGELLALALFEKSRTGGQEFEQKYNSVLELGGSKTPYELMAILGIDLNDEAFWQGGFDVIEKMVVKFESLWAENQA